MKHFLALVVLLIVSCGSPGLVGVSAGPPATAGQKLGGPLPTRLVVVSYLDNPNPYTEQAVAAVGVALDALIVRNSSGAAWVEYDVVSITLPRELAVYVSAGNYPPEGMPPRAPDTLLQLDCLAAVERRRFTVYFLPSKPQLYLGYAAGAAWVSALELDPDPLHLPVPHEFGHCLGFPDRPAPGTIMTNALGHGPDQANWAGWFDDASLASVGWLLR